MADLDCGIVNNSSSSKKLICAASNNCENKIKCVLTKILDVAYSFSDDTILDKFYIHLSNNSKVFVNQNDELFQWLRIVITEWNNLKPNIRVLAVKIAGIIANSRDGMNQLLKNNAINDICSHVKYDENNVSIILPFVEMCSEVIKHNEGHTWFLQSDLFHYILKLYYSNSSIYITRKTKEFIIKFLLDTCKLNMELGWSVMDYVIAPLNLMKLDKEPSTKQEILIIAQNFVGPDGIPEFFSDLIPKCENKMYELNMSSRLNKESNFEREMILSTLQLLCTLLETMVELNCSSYDICNVFKYYDIHLWAWKTLHAEITDTKISGVLSSLITYLNFSTVPRAENKAISEADLVDIVRGFLYLVQSLTYKRQYLVINNVCVLNQILTDKLLLTTVYLCKEDGVTYNFRSQVLFLHALPIFIYLRMARITHTDVADKFADKLFTMTSIQTKRVCYQYRDTVRLCPKYCNIEQLLRSSLQTVIGILKYLNKDQVVVAFQTFVHFLRDFVPDEHTHMTSSITIDSFEKVQKYPNILMDVLEGVEITIKNYNITWSESLEISCVLVLLMSLLCISDLSTPLSTKLLKIMRLTISNFIPPNLALLVENFKNSSLEKLGPLLLRKLHDLRWEIRDSALEVLQTISFLSELKFPAFQNLLLELNFPAIVICMVECDEESYVRASAIVCLKNMVKVKRLWAEALSDKQLLEKMLDCLKREPEGVVRKEAICLITAICNNHEVENCLMKDVYKQLVLSATSDLHWEVKVNALSFWEAVIEYENANQGMIDGAFPAVTFSKASRKIVTLTPAEIQKRLKFVLNELQKNGCLLVLWTALNDTSDLEVAKTSVIIISKLLKLLQQYGVVEDACGRATVLPPLCDGSSSSSSCISYSPASCSSLNLNLSPPNVNGVCKPLTDGNEIYNPNEVIKCNTACKLMAADDVIQSIMDAQDIELLSSVYTNVYQNGVENNNKQKIYNNECVVNNQFAEIISVDDFISKVSTLNLESIIKARCDWLEASDDLDSLLDDILAVAKTNTDINNTDNVNAMDCY